MTNTIFNRQQTLKEWKPIQSIQLPPHIIQDYNLKIQNIFEQKGCDTLEPSHLIELEGYQPLIDVNYVKYVALKHMNSIIDYINSKGIVLKDIEWNIKLLLNEITTNQVNEDYYLNTIDIYESLGSWRGSDIYDLINQAIRLDNKRMLYYLIFKEDYELADRVSEVIGE